MAQAGVALIALLTATLTEAQQQPTQLSGNTAVAKPHAAVPQTAPPAQEAPQAAPSLLDQPAQPALVQLDDGKLSVKADNSTLSGILHDISRKTGMKLDGVPPDQRVFGTYGPAAPRDVLSDLLHGTGYNVMMVGALGNGAPRELTLSRRTGGPATSGAPAMQVARQNNSGEDDDDSVVDQQDNPMPPRPETLAPEPEQQPHPPAQPGQVKTPQQMLQELQQLRQQQLQQQQQLNPQ